MAGLTIKCPKCQRPLKIRHSNRPCDGFTQAIVYCWECGIRGKVEAELKQLEICEFKPIPAGYKWRK